MEKWLYGTVSLNRCQLMYDTVLHKFILRWILEKYSVVLYMGYWVL